MFEYEKFKDTTVVTAETGGSKLSEWMGVGGNGWTWEGTDGRNILVRCLSRLSHASILGTRIGHLMQDLFAVVLNALSGFSSSSGHAIVIQARCMLRAL